MVSVRVSAVFIAAGDEEALCQGQDPLNSLSRTVWWPFGSSKVLEWARGKQAKLLDQQRLRSAAAARPVQENCVSAGLGKRKTSRVSIQHLMPWQRVA